MTYLEISSINKSFDNQMVLKDIDLSIAKGEFVAVVGPSGSGKSTLLDIVCGFTGSDNGEIYLENQMISHKSPSARDVAMVFQDYALFPHMTVAENIGFGLKVRKVKKSEREAKIKQVAKSLELLEYLNKYPKELSGGQKQRVALGRAIIREPKLFLMDEPLSNLDSSLRERTMNELMHLHKKLSATIIYVTHSQEEALIMADKIVVLNKGIIHQVATPQEVYRKPSDLFVAEFIGKPKMNILPVLVESGELNFNGKSLGTYHYPSKYEGKEVFSGVRSEMIQLCQGESTSDWKLSQLNYLGGETFYYIQQTDSGDNELVVKLQGEPTIEVGDFVELTFNHQDSLIFDKETNKRIGE